MSIDRLLTCACGHSVNEHEGTGCSTVLRFGPETRSCPCPLSRHDALERIIGIERTALAERARNLQARTSA